MSSNVTTARSLSSSVNEKRSVTGSFSSLPVSTDPDGHTEVPDRQGNVIRGDIEKPVKTIGNLALLSAAFNILNTWYGVGSTLIVGIPHGGPVTLIYGFILLTVIYTAIAMCLAELSAHWPTAGGQYHWTSLLAPKSIRRGLSYSCGIINTVGRIAICASMTLVDSQFILGLVAFNRPDYSIERWHVFVLYQAINIANTAFNSFALHRMPWTHHVGCGMSIFAFLLITVACLVMASPKQPSSFVWTEFINESGWQNSGMAFLLGLVNPNFGLAGLDGSIHLSEDTFDPATTVPLSIVSSLAVGCVTTLVFLVAMLYCVGDLTVLVNSRTGVPLFEMWYQATDSIPWTNIFIALWIAVGILTVIGSVSTASRLTWSFARDDALYLSNWVKKIDKRQGVPVNALLYNTVCISLLGCVYMSSTHAFSSLIGTGVLVEQMSYAIPAALMLWRKRAPRFLPSNSRFNMGRWGWIANALTVGWTVFVTVIYSFPQDLPVTSGNMNYQCVIIVLVALLAALNWAIHANKNYHGPKVILLS